MSHAIALSCADSASREALLLRPRRWINKQDQRGRNTAAGSLSAFAALIW
jgi:hypothetical protein